MKILLIYPNDSAEAYISRRPPVGLGYLGTILYNNKHNVKLLDMRIKSNNKERLIKLLKDFKPDVVGFSLLSMSIETVKDLVKLVKNNSKSIIIGGGPEATLLGEKILLDLKEFDCILLGDAEYSILKLIDSLEKKRKFPKVYDKEIIQNLDVLPFPKWELFNLKLYNKNIKKIQLPILTSRGCPYHCIYCESSKINGKYRTRSAKNVVDELEYNHKKFGVKTFQIMDDSFAINKERVFQICDGIIKRNLKINWIVGQGFSVSKADYNLFKKMKEAGCLTIFFGIESSDDEILRTIRKPHTVAQVEKAIKEAKMAGIKVKGNFIAGLPGSTFKKDLKYIKFFKRTGIDVPKMGHLMPFPNTEIYEWVKKEAKPVMDLDKLHRVVSGGRGTENTKHFGISFETKDYTFEERKKLVDIFWNESERYILQNMFGKLLGTPIFYLTRIRFIRSFGIKILNKFSDNL